MARFTGGTVHYLRRVNTGNYEHKEFAADIAWSADEGDDMAMTNELIEIAANRALSVVEKWLSPGAKLEPAPRQPTDAQVAARLAHNEAPDTRHAFADLSDPVSPRKPRKPRSPAAVQAIEEGNAAKARLAAKAAGDTELGGDANPDGTYKHTGDVELLDDPVDDFAAGPVMIDSIPEYTDDLTEADIDQMLVEAPRDVDDKELVVAMTKAVQKGFKISAMNLVREYTQTQLVTIPQNRRVDFLARLEALQNA